MTEQDNFSQRLMSARSLQGMSQQALAEASGVAAAQISRYESGKSSPRPEVVAKMSRAMGVDFDWLFTGNGPAPVGVGSHQNRQLVFGDPTVLVVPIPLDMQEKLKAAAEAEGRSLEAEVLRRLQSSLEIASGPELSELRGQLSAWKQAVSSVAREANDKVAELVSSGKGVITELEDGFDEVAAMTQQLLDGDVRDRQELEVRFERAIALRNAISWDFDEFDEIEPVTVVPAARARKLKP